MGINIRAENPISSPRRIRPGKGHVCEDKKTEQSCLCSRMNTAGFSARARAGCAANVGLKHLFRAVA